MTYQIQHLDKMVVWKSQASGDYAFGILPSNCYPEGRKYQQDKEDIKEINPFETWDIQLEIGVVEGQEEIEALKDKIV